MMVTIRKFEKKDIENKIRWMNDPRNNRFLHYDFPLEYEKTLAWYEGIKDREDRYDGVIEADGKPVGLIGLLSIEKKNKKAEYYIAMGEPEFKGRGISTEASKLLLEYAFSVLGLEKLYLYTETENTAAHGLFQKVGFRLEGCFKNDICSRGVMTGRYAFGLTKEDYYYSIGMTPVTNIDVINGNQIYIKRDDLLPYSFGGNKARKGMLFFREIDSGGYDCVVTYGSGRSNHCRVISNMAAGRGLPCYIIAPSEDIQSSSNRQMARIFGAKITNVPVSEVHRTIENKLKQLKEEGQIPYFIAGGGHGNIGTHAYAICYNEIKAFEAREKIFFDYIFLASGTGTTQAGLVAGQIRNRDERVIAGISIARKKSRGREIIKESIQSYLESRGMRIDQGLIDERTHFLDNYIGSGYGSGEVPVMEMIAEGMRKYGIPFDRTYTGKAFWAMKEYLNTEKIRGKHVLFIHTGGTPLFFDDIKDL